MSTETLAAVEVAAVTGQATYTWTLTLDEFNGKCRLTWHTTAPFRAQQGQIHLYSGGFPSNPTDSTVAWCWDDEKNHSFITDKAWGSGWCAAWIAQMPPNGSYVYVAKTNITKA